MCQQTVASSLRSNIFCSWNEVVGEKCVHLLLRITLGDGGVLSIKVLLAKRRFLVGDLSLHLSVAIDRELTWLFWTRMVFSSPVYLLLKTTSSSAVSVAWQ